MTGSPTDVPGVTAPETAVRLVEVPPSPAPSRTTDPAPGSSTGVTETAVPSPTPTTTADEGVPGPVPEPTPTPSLTEPATSTPTAPGPTSTPAPSGSPAELPVPVPTSIAPVWTDQPTVAASTIPTGALVTAALVLVVVLAAITLAILGRRRRAGTEGALPAEALPAEGLPAEALPAEGLPAGAVPAGAVPAGSPPGHALATAVPASQPAPDDAAGRAETVRFLMVLGEAMIDSSVPVAQVTQTLERVAAVNGAPDVEIVALPTALLVSVPSGAHPQTAASSTGVRQLRLHQVQEVLEVAELAERGGLTPAEGTARVRAAVDAPPLYRGPVRVLGYMGVSAGLAMILGGSLVDVLAAAALGTVIAGAVVAGTRVAGAYQALLVLGCAFVVSVAVFLLSRTGADVGMLAPLVAPLVSFLPGALLTTAAIDLATRQMVAGSARLAAGGMQLVLLALGITTAAALVGVPASDVGSAPYHPLGWAGPWVGVIVYGVGVVFHNCARRSTLPWILLVLTVAYAGQVLGGLFFGGVFSAFVGALLMTLVAMYASTRPTGPPTLVGFLPGFWLLVPGALGLVGVTSILGDDSRALATVVTAATTMVAISLGVLAGLALGTALRHRGGVLARS
ncbi:threonine/serine ThrE exporter family protein [Cellulomonas sp. NS3]|uniref:threonine/serine ThrE exporter family protein n=1 Tax=Cellulomonas sp. NS3 TaxID=2973977 RepID=UPI002161ABC5|nr:threonine/serine exporter family protein [Cellulomonas sp. NS3]